MLLNEGSVEENVGNAIVDNWYLKAVGGDKDVEVGDVVVGLADTVVVLADTVAGLADMVVGHAGMVDVEVNLHA